MMTFSPLKASSLFPLVFLSSLQYNIKLQPQSLLFSSIPMVIPMASSRMMPQRSKSRVKLGLNGILLCLVGFFVITASLYYSLQRLEQETQPNMVGSGNSEVNIGLPYITIFAAPRPLSWNGSDLVDGRQELAIRSWLQLSPNVDIVLFGQHPSILRFAGTLGPRVSVESRIDFTFLGTPFFHSMVARSLVSNSDISMLVDPETILLPDIITALQHAHKLNRDWFLFSISPTISHFPFHLDETGKHWLRKNGERIGFKKFQEFVIQERNWNNCSKRLLIAWNNGKFPLHAGVLPPFLYGKGLHNEWLVNEVVSSDLRFVINASIVPFSFYPQRLGQWFDNFSTDSGSGNEVNEEYIGNHLLASLYGLLYFQPNITLPIKLIKCLGQYLFIDQAKSTILALREPGGHTSHKLKSILGQEPGKSSLSTRLLQSRRTKKWMNCVEDIKLLDRKSQCSFLEFYKVPFRISIPSPFPFNLESLLKITADEDRSVVLAVAGSNYRDMLMSWVCRLRNLAVTNFLVCALDPDIYHFAILQGLPVFEDPQAPRNISFSDCHFGTECFQKVTKVKSRIVLQILKLGYNVLLSDVDVYWFENPLPVLRAFGPSTLVAQSDEYNETVPINLPRRLNSGFYFVRSDPASITAMEKVVKHASTSDLSEQPSFYDTLCGEGGINRVGDDRCHDPTTNLTVVFLDRDSFPNGAYKGIWERSNVRSACLQLGCLILHNNWISGRKRKLERQLLSGLWDYDPSSRMCLHSWHS